MSFHRERGEEELKIMYVLYTCVFICLLNVCADVSVWDAAGQFEHWFSHIFEVLSPRCAFLSLSPLVLDKFLFPLFLSLMRKKYKITEKRYFSFVDFNKNLPTTIQIDPVRHTHGLLHQMNVNGFCGVHCLAMGPESSRHAMSRGKSTDSSWSSFYFLVGSLGCLVRIFCRLLKSAAGPFFLHTP